MELSLAGNGAKVQGTWPVLHAKEQQTVPWRATDVTSY